MTTTSNAVQRVLDRLHHIKSNGAGWTARCPAHEDHENSLPINEGNDGRALLKCHAGCTVETVVKALGMDMKDLFADEGGGGGCYPPCWPCNPSTTQKKQRKFKGLRG